MITYEYLIDLPEMPESVEVSGQTVILSRNIVRFDNTGLWGCERYSKDWPDHPSEEDIVKNFDSIWDDWNSQYIAQQQEETVDDSDALLTSMYEQLISVQESQEATDAVLCDLYEALGGGQ